MEGLLTSKTGACYFKYPLRRYLPKNTYTENQTCSVFRA